MNKTKTYFDTWLEPNEFSNYEFTEPSKENKKKLKLGDFVKVNNKFELFWVEIVKFQGNAIFGRVDNKLLIKKNYEYDDIVVFGQQHIFDILSKEDKNNIRQKAN